MRSVGCTIALYYDGPLHVRSARPSVARILTNRTHPRSVADCALEELARAAAAPFPHDHVRLASGRCTTPRLPALLRPHGVLRIWSQARRVGAVATGRPGPLRRPNDGALLRTRTTPNWS